MARGGNDHDTAVAEIETQYGVGHQTAADLLDTHDSNYDLTLQRALAKAVDEPATAALDADDIHPAFGGEIVSFAVRGGRLVVVEDVDGAFKKWHKDIPGAAKKASKAGAAAGAVPSTQQTKLETQTGEAAPSGATEPPAHTTTPGPNPDLEPAPPGTPDPASPDISAASTPGAQGEPGVTEAADGSSSGDGDDGAKAPKNVTVEAIREQLAAEDTTPPKEVRRKDDLWGLLTPAGQQHLVELAGPDS